MSSEGRNTSKSGVHIRPADPSSASDLEAIRAVTNEAFMADAFFKYLKPKPSSSLLLILIPPISCHYCNFQHNLVMKQNNSFIIANFYNHSDPE